MNKKINRVLAIFLLGGLTTALPSLIRLCLFVGIGLVIFMKYDEFEYEQRIKGEDQ